MHPSIHAVSRTDQAAIVMAGSGEVVTYGQLDARSNQTAHLFRHLGLQTGDVVAVLLDNHPRYLEIAWGAQRSGLYAVGISSRLTASEVVYIVGDSGAQVVVTSLGLEAARALPGLLPNVTFLFVDAASEGDRSFDRERAAFPVTPIADERHGMDMLYSSGTTGRPKGVRPPLPIEPDITAPNPLTRFAEGALGFDASTIYLSPAPLYHAAPLRWSMTTHRLGGTVVVMDKFDAETALANIERFRVTHSQWVPTHFVRMLKLPEAAKTRYDFSSHKVAIHAAAPCAVPVKQAMIDWWGPILAEYYAGTEGNGLTFISSPDWLTHKGSVGRPVFGAPHVCDPAGEPLPPRKEGVIYFEGGPQFAYHNDPEKTAAARNDLGWTTLGDIGWLDEDGFLYLTDRRSFMIISGGVNIYPQEIENLLITHPRVMDAAVVGAPDEDLGEKVVAVIQPAAWSDATPAVAAEIAAWLRGQLSGVKIPRQIDFMQELPRHATGKLYKRLLRDRYWGKTDTTIVGSGSA